ncbi:MAG TPA: thioredoxin family protein [Solirubrobacteraceae bacterium]|jgi:peroxiredoxin|nr:thioredoxin family protein [Solirubrobacteraceae bacterium]
MPEIGEIAPKFILPDTDGATHGPDGASATVVVFTCNHCPYALAWHERTIAVAHAYADRGVKVLAINPNDAERYPRDSIEAMRARVQAGDFDGVPYLRDASQEVAHAYDAKTTPDVFVLDADGVLRYRGAPDADYEDPSQNASYLRAALDAVLEGREPEPAYTHPVGCSIKWKSEAEDA